MTVICNQQICPFCKENKCTKSVVKIESGICNFLQKDLIDKNTGYIDRNVVEMFKSAPREEVNIKAENLANTAIVYDEATKDEFFAEAHSFTLPAITADNITDLVIDNGFVVVDADRFFEYFKGFHWNQLYIDEQFKDKLKEYNIKADKIDYIKIKSDN